MAAKRRLITAILPLLIVILVPVLLRRGKVVDDPTADQLIIISPHNEAIRYEFENAFRTYYRDKTGRDVDIDWRAPGGTSDIVRYIDSSYTAAFRNLWTAEGEQWTPDVQAAFKDRRLAADTASETAWKARQMFLQSEIGVGIDLFFGGGQYDFGKFAAVGYLVPGGVRERHPEWFEGPTPIISPGMSGEIWTDSEDRYYGACLSAFGICYNLDRLEDLAMRKHPDGPALDQWSDLADPKLFGHIGVADPSKRGSINKCFEMLIQQQMAETVARYAQPGKPQHPAAETAAALTEGWNNAMLLIRIIGANAKYFTFSASKVPVDVAQGHIAAGMCIDFYGRSQAEWEQQHLGREIMRYVTPAGGSSVSADPIGMLRGAPHPEAAELFLDFTLSKEGQKLWNYRPGEPGGPDRYALRRLPIRRDLYTPEDRAAMSDPDAHPFQLAEQFTYHPEWTARLFGLIRVLIRVMTIDCQDELSRAWKAILDAGGPERCPEAVNKFRQLPFDYNDTAKVVERSQNPEQRIALARDWAVFFRKSYRDAETIAQTARTARNAAAAQ
jgi:ABC-type Fe3+ transport system substrate-binding protein